MADLSTARRLREERAVLAKKTNDMAVMLFNEKRDFTAEEKTGWDQLDTDYKALTGRIEIAELAESRMAEQSEPQRRGKAGREDTEERRDAKGRRIPPGAGTDRAEAVTEETRALALQAWAKRGKGLTTAQKDACKLMRKNPRGESFGIRLNADYRSVKRECGQAAHLRSLESRAALSSQIGSTGGYTIPEGFQYSLETALLAYANMRAVGEVVRTDSGADWPWPTANDTTAKGSILGESTAPSSSTLPSFAQIVLHAFKYTSGTILCPSELLEDSAFALATWLGDTLGTRIGRIQADHFTTGLGAGQPTGIVTAATSGKTFASATAFTWTELLDLKHSVDPAYRGPGAGWMFNDGTLKAVKQFTDGIGRPLWQSGIAVGAPDAVDGDPIAINQSMASIATGNKSVLYGMLSKLKIRDVNGVRMFRLEERYRDVDQTGFVLFMRSDSNLIDAGTHPVKYGVHP